MSYLADPPDDPIDIDGGIQYNYVIAQQGALAITADLVSFTDFTYSIVSGSPALLRFTYTGATDTVPIYHTLALNIQMPEGTVRHEINLRILPTGAQRVPNITNATNVSKVAGATFRINILTDITADSFSAENLPGTLGISSDGHITGTAPATNGFYVITFVATLGAYHYKRYFVLIVGTGYPPGVPPPVPPPGTSSRLYFDGDYTVAQLAGMPEYEIPFKTDPKPYVYKLAYWQLFANYSEPALGDAGPLGGFYVGASAGSIKSVGGGVIEFRREYALVPDTRSEYESFVFPYQLLCNSDPPTLVDVPVASHSRIQFDYFQTDDPSTIDLPNAMRAFAVCELIVLPDGWGSIPPGAEILAEDATFTIWKPGIYERKMRFVKIFNLIAQINNG